MRSTVLPCALHMPLPALRAAVGLTHVLCVSPPQIKADVTSKVNETMADIRDRFTPQRKLNDTLNMIDPFIQTVLAGVSTGTRQSKTSSNPLNQAPPRASFHESIVVLATDAGAAQPCLARACQFSRAPRLTSSAPPRPVRSQIDAVLAMAGVQEVQPIYISLKEFPCCDVADVLATGWLIFTFGGWLVLATCCVGMGFLSVLDRLPQSGCMGCRPLLLSRLDAQVRE